MDSESSLNEVQFYPSASRTFQDAILGSTFLKDSRKVCRAVSMSIYSVTHKRKEGKGRMATPATWKTRRQSNLHGAKSFLEKFPSSRVPGRYANNRLIQRGKQEENNVEGEVKEDG